MYRAQSKQQAIASAVSELVSQSSISNITPGSKARALIDAVARVTGSISQDVSLGILETLLPNASGTTLDLIAAAYGIERYPAEPARVEVADQNFRYYVKGQTFGDINNGNDIVIPAGTQIRAQSKNFTLYFIQRESVTLPAASSEVFFAADQVNTVSPVPVGPNVMTKHNFTAYAESNFSSLLVTNAKGTAGRAREIDSNLRFRIRNYMTTSAGANSVAVRIAALSVPGVSDVRILANRAGLGTYDVVVYGTTPVVSDSIISQVQARANRVAAVGTRAIAVAPRLVGVSMRVEIKFKNDTPQGEKNSIVSNIKDDVRSYINDLLPGQEFSINQLTNRILSSSEEIIDIGTPGSPFAELLIWKSGSPGGTRYSRRLKTNYLIQDDEDLIVEPYLTTSLEIVEAT